ncbi:hypothetical protein DVW05_11940 [Clostridium botulinum]|uniref:toxin-antitoxin system YwqK family antitoxin n=1 Tax=Clostridium sp. ZBS18 TaxID=2949967 RepID=UPI001D28E277|nr:hypothetical protein [Clostridium sp. ZBS18]MBN1056053.1 hypothetical protein [Clostridium botulinum]
MGKSVLTEKMILQIGIEFSGDVCYSGEYGQQVFDKPMEDGGKPIDGIIYEKNEDGHVGYYKNYKNGIPNGESVEFYASGRLRSKCIMNRGTIDGEKIAWYENGKIKSKKNCKYGLVIECYEWDEEGNLINKKKNLTEGEKKIFDKCEKLEARRRSKL